LSAATGPMPFSSGREPEVDQQNVAEQPEPEVEVKELSSEEEVAAAARELVVIMATEDEQWEPGLGITAAREPIGTAEIGARRLQRIKRQVHPAPCGAVIMREPVLAKLQMEDADNPQPLPPLPHQTGRPQKSTDGNSRREAGSGEFFP